MLTLPGYSRLQTLHQGSHSLVFKGVRLADNQAVVLRQLRPELVTPTTAARFRQEFELLATLDHPNIVKLLAMTDYRGAPIAVMADTGGLSVASLFHQGHSFSVVDAASIALQTVKALAYIHERRLVHKDVSPGNILFNVESGEATLIDFSISGYSHDDFLHGQVEGTLHYIAPEQTGRSNRATDYRADYYSLGATLYHLLTGQPPFAGRDSLEIVHAHLAIAPEAPQNVNADVSLSLSRVVTKLLAKDPNDRYQSAQAITADLQHCIQSMRLKADDQNFEPGLDDIAEQLNLPSQLFEREPAITELQAALDQAIGGKSRICIIVADSGVGKTALLREFMRKTNQERTEAIVALGTYQPLSRDIPYRAISQALNDVCRQLVSRTDFPVIRRDMEESVRGFEQPLLELIPDLRLFLPSISVSGSSASVSQTQLLQGLEAFIRCVCRYRSAMVVCLDNLHWIDGASLQLFEPLFNQLNVPNLLIIGGYRTGELEPEDNTRLTVEQMLALPNDITLLRPPLLTRKAVSQIITRTLFRSAEETEELTNVVFQRTEGNPLAVRELLTELYDQQILHFNRAHREWDWDPNRLLSIPATDSVGTQLTSRLAQLGEEVKKTLEVAACLGDEFTLEAITAVTQSELTNPSDALFQAASEGYVTELRGQRYNSQHFFRFSHERIPQALYQQLDHNKRRHIHAQLGLYLLGQRDQGADLFEIVKQLNVSFEAPADSVVDVEKLGQLNIEAAERSASTGANQSAFKYYKTAIQLLGDALWHDHKQGYSLHINAAEAAYLCGDQPQMQALLDVAIEHALDPLEISQAIEISIRGLIASDQFDRAIEVGKGLLEQLDCPLPGRAATWLQFPVLLFRTNGREVSGEPPRKMTGANRLAAMRILRLLCQAGYFSGSRDTPAFAVKMTDMSLRFGHAPETPFGFSVFGASMISLFGTIETGYRFGQMALQSSESIDGPTLTFLTNFLFSWKEPLRQTLEPLARAYELGMKSGEIDFALIASMTGAANAFVMGQDLNSLDARLTTQNQNANRYNQTPILSMGCVYQQTVRNLVSTNPKPWELEGEIYSETELLAFHQEQGDDITLANLFILKMYLATLFRNNSAALEFASRARQHLGSVNPSPAVPFFITYETLALIQSEHQHKPGARFSNALRIQLNLRQLRKWAHHNPEGHAPGLHLVEAALAAKGSNSQKTLQRLQNAMDSAQTGGLIKEQALANEMTARFYQSAGNTDLASFYVDRARSIYRRWGANTKVQALEKDFHNLIDTTGGNVAGSNYSTTSPIYSLGMNTAYSGHLDLGSVIKASQLLSGEILLDNLLQQLMQVTIESAGANRASLILTDDSELRVEITTWFDGHKTEHLLDRTILAATDNLPISVIQYVARTQEDLVLDDPVNEDIFTQDQFIQGAQPGSILCIPVQSKSHLIGVLYLENSTVTHAFTRDRVTILKLLASQAAIAIENAKLYRQLNDSKNKYQSMYNNALEGMFEIDKHGALTNINPAAVALLGYNNPGEISDREGLSSNFQNPDDFGRFFKEIRQSGRVLGFDTNILRKDGTTAWVSISAQIVRDEGTGDALLEGSVVDISERRLREEAEQAKVVAEAADETKSQFLATMSHEIRTPMNAILGYTDLALESDLSNEQREYLKTIRSSSEHLIRVVNDILDISKVESGKFDLLLKPFDLKDLFTEVNSLFSLAARNKAITLVLPSDIPDLRLIADPVRISQILINLVGNAIKFTDHGTISIALAIDKQETGAVRLEFAIEDTGRGIIDTDLEHVFESFTSADEASGTGLGLTICRRLVHLMDGEISATSTVGKGSCFTFYVMVKEAPSAIEPHRPIQTVRHAETNNAPVLLVEDNPINMALAQSVLSKAGYRVTACTDGKQALAALYENQFLAVLMDIRMPVMDGIEAVTHIRNDDKLKDNTVIALSAGVLEDEIKAAMQAGFDHYLSKPIDFSTLLSLLESLDDTRNESQPVPQERSELPTIRGVDFARALTNHGDDSALLLRLTTDFVKYYGDSAEKLRALVHSDLLEEAERLVHNLAGVSGSFGANNLMTISRDIEHKLQDGVAITEQLAVFTAEVENLTAAIEELEPHISTTGNERVAS